MAISNTDPKYQAVARSINCYFCNEVFDERSYEAHLTQCGAILDPCPKQCGAYVQRKYKNKHLAECNAKPCRPRSTYETLERDTLIRRAVSTSNLHIEHEIEKVKLALEYEKQSRQDIQKQLLSIQNLHLRYIQHNKELNAAYDSLKNNWYEEIEKRKMLIHKTRLELDQIYSKYKIMEEWKNGIECDIQQIKYQLQENNNKIEDMQYRIKMLDDSLLDANEIKSNVDLLNKKLEDEQIKWQLESLTINEKFDKFQDFFQEENALISAVWNDQNNEIKNLKETLDNQTTAFNELKTKYHGMNYDVKNVEQINLLTSDQINSQGKELEDVKKTLAQLKSDFGSTTSLPDSVYYPKTNGFMIWRIDSFKEKTDNSKLHDVVLNSPVFYSREYGYKLRLQAYLNGIGKWKNRHIIISLQVVKGDWDPLLIWPCNIEAKVAFKDQTVTQGKDYVKTITAKRQSGDEENEDPQESSSQYIFIPHTVLQKYNYVQNNTIFFEIKIINDNLT